MLNTAAGDYEFWCNKCKMNFYGAIDTHKHISYKQVIYTYSQDERMANALERIAAALEKIANKDG